MSVLEEKEVMDDAPVVKEVDNNDIAIEVKDLWIGYKNIKAY